MVLLCYNLLRNSLRMSSTPNWEQLFNKRIYCSVCAQDITLQPCECNELTDTTEEDSYDDPYED